MNDHNDKPYNNYDLRRQAENILASKPMSAEIREKDLRILVHELQVHQVELEIQNEELRNAQVIIEESRKRYIELYDYAPVGYFTIDNSGVILEANLTISELLGYSKTDLIGRPLNAFIFKEDMDIFFVHKRKLVSKDTVDRCVLRLVKKDKSKFPSQLISTSYVEESLSTINILIAVIDITVRKHLEEERDQYVKDIANANRELESFTYSASHDLNAPLNTVAGFCKILLEDYSNVLDETGKKLVHIIDQNVGKMKELINDLLRLSKISQQELTFQDVNLSRIASAITSDLRLLQPHRSVEVIIQENLRTQGDEHLLKILLTNLLGNALKYTEKTKKTHIELGSFQKDNEEVFFVRDNGAGFDMAYAHKLFVPFQRLHTDSEFGGTGIGLAIVNRIINRHKGRIWAEAEKNRGATFYFTLGKNR